VSRIEHDSRAAHALGPSGPFAQDEDFAPRAVQQQMAEAVERAIATRDELVVEAGTGTGKTFAYLVPALLSGRRVIVSTGTKNLQDQLYHRDLPRVCKALGVHVKTALLKGRANYVCRHRLEQAAQDGRLASRAEVADLARVRAWERRTERGDISELTGLSEQATVWSKVTSTTENCLGSQCPQFDRCFVVKARREAQDADLLVVNHHLLFADLAIKREGFGEILPGAQAFVLDEAHQVPELAGQFFGESISSRQLLEIEQDALREAAEVQGAKAALAAVGQRLDPILKSLRLALGDGKARAPLPPRLHERAIHEAMTGLQDALAVLAQALAALEQASVGLAGCKARAELALGRLERLAAEPETGFVHWYELTERGFTLSITPLDVAEALTAFRRNTEATWVFTSATLSVAGEFEHYLKRVGLDEARTVSLPSPFDFEHNALLYLPRDLPDPSLASDYTERMVAAARPVLESSRGRAFLLFTSHRALRRAAELLADLPYPLLVQGTAPRAELLERFRAAGNAVLLGAASFWEGVDVKGEALSLVVIDRLPFAAPDDPVLEARLNAIREQGGNPFAEFQIPAAAIALKQGAGRLIRDIADRGVLMLCDPRVLSKSYGRTLRECLPPMPITRELADVQRFFALA
jgi:ATP-dependent DNA helicase DinG